MIKKLLSEKEHYTLSQCAQDWSCSEKDILQLASKGNINLQANLAYTEGDLYVINDSLDTPKELKLRSWKGYQTLSPKICEQLLIFFDKEVPITSIVATQKERDEFNLNNNDTVEISLDPSIIVSGDIFDPVGSNIQKDYQYITTKDVWVSREEYERLSPDNKDDHEHFDSHRKPHTVYISNRIKLSKERRESWERLKQLANKSIGGKQVELPGHGKIYLRRV